MQVCGTMPLAAKPAGLLQDFFHRIRASRLIPSTGDQAGSRDPALPCARARSLKSVGLR
jgi:hypothetical protein